MNPLWRSTWIQIVAIVCMTIVTALVITLKADEKIATILVTSFAMALAQLISRARSEASQGGSSDGTSLMPGPMIRMKGPRDQDRDEESGPRKMVVRALGFAFISCLLCAFTFCGQPPQTVATEVGAGVNVAKGVCTVIGLEDPNIALVCPMLDDKGQPAKDDASAPRMMRVKVPRATWERMQEPDSGR